MTYLWIASPLSRFETGLHAVLMVEQSRRLTVSGRGTGTRLLMRAAWDDAGYCLDAPSEMPAGGCENLEVDDKVYLPSQLRAN